MNAKHHEHGLARAALVALWCAAACTPVSSTPPPTSDPGREQPVVAAEVARDVLYRGGSTRTGAFAAPSVGPQAKLVWTVRLQDARPITAAPLPTSLGLFVGTAAGNAAALDPVSGNRLWDLEIESDNLRPASLLGGRLLFGHDHGLTAIDPATGQIVWEHGADAVRGSPARIGEAIYVSTRTSVIAVGLEDHARLWTRELQGGAESSPATDGDRIYVGAENFRLLALDPGGGETVWGAKVEGRIAATPLVTDEDAVICGVLGRTKPTEPIDGVRAFAAEDGKELWRFKTQASVSTPLAYDDSMVYFASHAHRVGALDSTTGELLWAFRPRKPPEPGAVASGPIVVEDEVYVAMGRAVYGLDRPTGKRLWKVELDSPVSTALTYREQRIFVGSHTGAIYSVGPASGG